MTRKSNDSGQISKRGKGINKRRTGRSGKIYNTNKAEFKKMVLTLTSITLSPRRSDSVRPSPPAHVSNPQPTRLNGAPLPFRYPAVPIRTNSVIVNASTAELSNAKPPSPPSLPSPPSPTSFPSPPSPPSLPLTLPLPSPGEQDSMEASVAAFIESFKDRMADDDLNPEHPSAWFSFPPTSDEEQQPENIPPPVPAILPSENIDWLSFLDDLRPENISPPNPATLLSEILDWPNPLNDPQSENIPPPIPATLPSGSLDWSNSRNNMRSENIQPPVPAAPPSEILSWPNSSTYDQPSENIPPPFSAPLTYMNHGPDYLQHLRSGNIPPPVPAPLPSGNLLHGPNYRRSGNIPPPVPATLPSERRQLGWPNPRNDPRSENISPPVPATLPSRNLDSNNLRSKNIPHSIPAPLPSGRLDRSNYPYDVLSQNMAQSGFGTVPSWDLDWSVYPSVRRVENIPSQAAANLPPDSLPKWPSSSSH